MTMNRLNSVIPRNRNMMSAWKTKTINIVRVRPILSERVPATMRPEAFPTASSATRMKPALFPVWSSTILTSFPMIISPAPAANMYMNHRR